MKVFIDGSAGTTGLRIVQRLSQHPAVQLLSLPEAQRKDEAARADIMNQADIVFLCLPDDAARQAVTFVQNPDTKIIDTSTAHRVQAGWNYGFAELSSAHRDALRTGKRTAVPGCHASGFVALVYPLVAKGLLKNDTFLSAFSLSGYSGGGKKAIAQYQDEARPAELDAPRVYATAQQHKHLPEMTKICGLAVSPAFVPVIEPFYSGMVVTVPVALPQLAGISSAQQLREFYADFYRGQPLMRVSAQAEDFISANVLSGLDIMQLIVSGEGERLTLCARFDNLGKGASGAAIQCMNIMSGLDETTGLQTE